MENLKKNSSSKDDLSRLNTRDMVAQFFNNDEEYFCESLEGLLGKLTLPTSFSKQKGVFFIFVTDGEFDIKVGYENYTASRGQLIIVQPQKPFSIESFTPNIQGYALNLKGDGVLGTMGNHSLIFHLDFLEAWSNSLFIIDRPPIEYIQNIFSRILWEYNNQKDSLNIVNAYVITLLLELNKIHNDAIHSNRAAIDLSRRFKKEVFNTLNTQLSVSDYAERLSITPNHLNKSIKSVMGISASQLINKIKVTEAKCMLMMSNITISDVAERLGFTDTSYFSRFFKKHESVTPTDFRKMIDLS